MLRFGVDGIAWLLDVAVLQAALAVGLGSFAGRVVWFLRLVQATFSPDRDLPISAKTQRQLRTASYS